MRRTICEKLIQTLSEIKSGKVYRGVLWILGEYAESVPEIQETFQQLRKVLGEIPILASEQRLLDESTADEGDKEKDGEVKTESTKPKVLADGTYATETAYTSISSARLEAVKAAAKPPLRSESSAIVLIDLLHIILTSTSSRRRFLHRICSFIDTHQACPTTQRAVIRQEEGQCSPSRGMSCHIT